MIKSRRQPHAALDLSSRNKKAVKIERLLELHTRSSPIHILEIGTGSGGIAHYFATHESLNCVVDAIDIVDQRQISDGYNFTKVPDATLPFEDNAFDVVLSNHVIEHVGDRHAQLKHLCEIYRVMRPDGIGYIAVPNRWMLVEPHYGLIFLSWLPHGWRNRYLRLMRHVKYYDCEPLQLGELDSLLEQAQLKYEHLEVEGFRKMLEIEGTNSIVTCILEKVPNRLLALLRPIFPTLICRLSRS